MQQSKPPQYPLLSFLYHIYVLDEIEEMSTDAQAFFDRFDLPKAARSLLKDVKSGGSPSPEQIREFLALLEAELGGNPAVW